MANDAASLMVESVFIAKLISVELYGPPVDGLALQLMEKAPSGLTEAGLLAAADQIIRKRGSGSFPKFPECFAAITDTASRAVTTSAHADAGQITKETYPKRALEFCRRAGKTPSDCPVIMKHEKPDAWEAWQSYFRAIGMRAMSAHMNGTSVITVPEEYPWQFDLYSPIVPPIAMR
jgi:hypothetical protein